MTAPDVPLPEGAVLSKAIEVAMEAHSGQFRRDGVTPYITHPAAVASSLSEESDEIQAVAWLHDVVEDTTITVPYLRMIGFPDSVANAVALLTKQKGDSYESYLDWINSNPIARKVKIADIRHNLSDSPTKKQVEKYTLALARLNAPEPVTGERLSPDQEVMAPLKGAFDLIAPPPAGAKGEPVSDPYKLETPDIYDQVEEIKAKQSKIIARDCGKKLITMQDIRLCAGEGKLSADTVLQAANVIAERLLTAANAERDKANTTIERLSEGLAYILSCHAATMQSMPKRTSKYEWDRHVSIGESLKGFLAGESPNRVGVFRFNLSDSIKNAVDRFERAKADRAALTPKEDGRAG